MTKTIALVVAAGCGSRTGGDIPKQYRRLGGKALLAHCLDHLRHPRIDGVRVVIGPGQEALYAGVAADLPPPVMGGAERRDSVRLGLEALATEAPDIVLIHDAARPFLPPVVVDRLLDALADHDGAVPVLGVVDTLARSGTMLGETVARDGLARVQTPQAFRFAAIWEAHQSFTGEATDDAQVARAAGIAVAAVAGDPMLEKLTYEEDFARAEERLAMLQVSRTGLGFDVHALAEGEELWLAGIRVPHEKGLKGHSDADVALHALTDAVLGAIGAGDIGDHFPPSDPQWRGASSDRFLEHARDLVEARGGRIDHVDLTIICEAPRIGPHKAAMRERIAGLLGLPLDRVSLKATTTERLGFAGRGEGIAAQAAATVRVPEDR
ncbi:MAG: bifunctional 2-C-methyl-D-erythritol 4-phosphate cytidylyltransferase/2-C-methyl-D-erythritol 2,4-cyclodiphosphate synthase [Allosphingosinicella sp.]|uniref:bifunctional 2-C-methyl-D-erythritol 4-phosphate cytidylyltransferase/2-C-methyl-D-erythritol 2,4-cyclodiphosphate synthase n=1 Tax=Allosphingosinicella sp. TaxID=2823234 RepID=UPI00394BFADE